MKISIITTAFNIENFIAETIESVLYQRGNFELEYIVVDAQSTDKTGEIIAKYKKMVDEGFFAGRNLAIEMKVITEPDRGCSEGYAKGVKYATGDVVGMIGGDDFYFPNALQTVTDIFTQLPQVEWITGRQTAYNELGANVSNPLPCEYNTDFIKKGIYGNLVDCIQHESCFYRKSLLDKVDLNKFSSYKLAADFYLWFVFADHAQLYIADTNLGGFRFRSSQLSSNSEKYKDEMNHITNCETYTDKEQSLAEEMNFAKLWVSDYFKRNSSDRYIVFNQEKNCWELSQKTISQLVESNYYSLIEHYDKLYPLKFLKFRLKKLPKFRKKYLSKYKDKK